MCAKSSISVQSSTSKLLEVISLLRHISSILTIITLKEPIMIRRFKSYTLGASAFLIGASALSAEITSSYTDGSTYGSANGYTFTVNETVAAGDYFVFSLATNKKPSVTGFQFSTTAADSFTVFSTAIGESNDANPDSLLAYVKITAGGTYDFTNNVDLDSSNTNPTVNWGYYIISGATLADTASAYGTVDSANDGGPTSADLALTFDLGASYDDILVLEAGGSTNSLLTRDTVTGNAITEQYAGGNTNSSRLGGSDATQTGVSTVTYNYDLAHTGSGTNANANGSGGIAGLAFVAVPEPGTFALISGFLAFGFVALRRRK